jgi:hypothetical protein
MGSIFKEYIQIDDHIIMLGYSKNLNNICNQTIWLSLLSKKIIYKGRQCQRATEFDKLKLYFKLMYEQEEFKQNLCVNKYNSKWTKIRRFSRRSLS